MTKTYIGTKIVRAWPSPRDGKLSPEGGEEGYIVQYPDGHTSWSPKATFEAAYREVTDDESALIPRPTMSSMDEDTGFDPLPRGVINEERATGMVDGGTAWTN